MSHRRNRSRDRTRAIGLPAALVVTFALAAFPACRGRDSQSEPGAAAPGSPATGAAKGAPDGGAREPEPVRLARAALHDARVPLYPGADGLDATEFEKNKLPFIAVDFFTLDAPDRVSAFYDRELRDRTAQRDTTREAGSVRYDFEEQLAGLSVKPWSPQGRDSSGVLARFDRRDAQGVTTEELDRYGKLLAEARTHVIVNLPRPEPAAAKP
jgi:hypothetical protein